MVRVMKKGNATIKASEGLAKELELQGYVEVPAKQSKSDTVATQPIPYTEEEIKQVDKVAKVEQAKAEAREKVDDAKEENDRTPADVEGNKELTNAELKSELDALGVEYKSSATKAELQAALDEAKK